MKVIDELTRALDKLVKDPENIEFYNEIGNILYMLKDYENAERFLERAYMRLARNEDVLYNYALVLYEQGKYEKSLSMYQEYQIICPKDSLTLYRQNEINYLLGYYEPSFVLSKEDV